MPRNTYESTHHSTKACTHYSTNASTLRTSASCPAGRKDAPGHCKPLPPFPPWACSMHHVHVAASFPFAFSQKPPKLSTPSPHLLAPSPLRHRHSGPSPQPRVPSGALRVRWCSNIGPIRCTRRRVSLSAPHQRRRQGDPGRHNQKMTAPMKNPMYVKLRVRRTPHPHGQYPENTPCAHWARTCAG